MTPAGRNHPHRRFRQPGDAADRPARARGGRLFGDRPVPRRRRGVQPSAAQGHHPVRRPGVGDRAGKPAGAANPVRQRPAAARHLLRPADAAPAIGWQGRHLRPEGVRPRLHRDRRPERLVRRPVADRREAPGVDEPRRPGREPGARLRGRRRVRRRALRDRHQRGGAALFADVPPGGRAHARRRQAAGQFRAPHLRLRRRLDHGRLPRRQDRRNPRAGGQGQGDLRPVGRGRQRGRGGADPRGGRRAADLRLRRPRPDARQ